MLAKIYKKSPAAGNNETVQIWFTALKNVVYQFHKMVYRLFEKSGLVYRFGKTKWYTGCEKLNFTLIRKHPLPAVYPLGTKMIPVEMLGQNASW